MSLVFPEVDFSSARVRSYAPVLPPQVPSGSGSRGVLQTPVVTGPRGVLQAPVVTGPRGVRRPPPPAVTEPLHVETPTNARSSTRISLVRHPAPPPQEEAPVTKKSKKGGKEKSKDKKGKSKSSKAKSSNVKEKELVQEDAESDEGIMHPVDLVIHKKKRKGREHTGSRTVISSQLVFNTEEMRETAARGFSVGSSGNARVSQQQQQQLQQAGPRSRAPAASPASCRRSAPQPDLKVGAAVTVLKKSRSDGGKRRPSHP